VVDEKCLRPLDHEIQNQHRHREDDETRGTFKGSAQHFDDDVLEDS
jgi:hypothetical protein